MVDITLTAFAGLAGILFIGFLGELIFKKFEIPGVLLLLATGYIIGPVYHLVPQESLLGLKSLFGAFTLLVVLFDGGMMLNIYTVIKQSFRPFIFGIILIVTSAAVTAIVAHYILGFDSMLGVLLGVVLAGSAPAITIPIASKLKIPENVKTFIILEPSFSDVISAILVIAVTGLVLSGTAINAQATGRDLLATFSIGAVVGAAVGLVWVLLIKKIEEITEFVYAATLAVLLFTYVFVEYFGASGLIAALIFGLMLGNRKEITGMLKLDVEESKEAEKLRPFHAEISFLVRTFFFTYLGMIVTIPSQQVLMMSALIVVGLFIARIIATYLSTIRNDELSQYNMLISSFVDRGLSVAVLSTYPLTIVSQVVAKTETPAFKLLKDHVALFPNIAFMVIVFAAVVSTIGITLTKPREEEDLRHEFEHTKMQAMRDMARTRLSEPLKDKKKHGDLDSPVTEERRP